MQQRARVYESITWIAKRGDHRKNEEENKDVLPMTRTVDTPDYGKEKGENDVFLTLTNWVPPTTPRKSHVTDPTGQPAVLSALTAD